MSHIPSVYYSHWHFYVCPSELQIHEEFCMTSCKKTVAWSLNNSTKCWQPLEIHCWSFKTSHGGFIDWLGRKIHPMNRTLRSKSHACSKLRKIAWGIYTDSYPVVSTEGQWLEKSTLGVLIASRFGKKYVEGPLEMYPESDIFVSILLVLPL